MPKLRYPTQPENRQFFHHDWHFHPLQCLICTLVRDCLIPSHQPPLPVNFNLPGVGWICLGLDDKARPLSLHLLPKHQAFTVLRPCSPASSDTGCIIYVEKTLPGQASIWPSWNIHLSNLAPSLKHHIITKVQRSSANNTAPHSLLNLQEVTTPSLYICVMCLEFAVSDLDRDTDHSK